ncbi:MAG: ATP-binding protein [Thermoactinomyces sp.]
MDRKQELIARLTGIKSSRKSYYRKLIDTVEELKNMNKQLEVINRLTQIQVNNSWEEVSSYIACQLSHVLHFDKFMLTLIDQSAIRFYISEQAEIDWSGHLLKRQLPTGSIPSVTEFNKLLQKEGLGLYAETICLKNQSGKIYGFLTLSNNKKIEYSANELAFFKNFGEHTRVSIENNILFKDVSEKVEIEAQLIQSAKLAALGEMAAGIAHELNSPLTAILGNVQLLMRRIKDEQFHRMLVGIYQCGIRSKKIIQSLLAFSRQEEYRFEDINPNEVVEDALGLIGYQLSVSGISIKKELDRSLPHVRGSHQQIEQVIINLLLNAKDAVQERTDPLIIIKTSGKYIEKHPFVSIDVWDNGVGIEQEHLPRIFNPFFTTKEKKKGTGLGLSVSLGIAEAHGGKILADSKAGEYCRFSLLLPVPVDRGGEK